MTKETVVLKIDSETKRILTRLTKALERLNPNETTAISGKEPVNVTHKGAPVEDSLREELAAANDPEGLAALAEFTEDTVTQPFRRLEDTK